MITMNDLSGAAQTLLKLAESVAQCEAALEAAKRAHREMETDTLPEMMRELGVSELTLESGEKLTLADEVACSIPEARRWAAADWLEARGYGGILKSSLAVEFGAGELAVAQGLADQVAASTGRAVAIERKVHPATLKSFVKERMRAGETLPEDIFSIHPYSAVKVTKARRTASKV